MTTISRRAAPTARVAAAVIPAAAAVSPDADLIRKAAEFIAAERKMARKTRYLGEKLMSTWTEQDRTLDAASRASARRYHERLEEISMAEPKTPEGLIAQAQVVLWHFNHPCGFNECLAWNLVESIHRVLGVPMPRWAT